MADTPTSTAEERQAEPQLPPPGQLFLTSEQAAAVLGISKLTLERIRRKGGKQSPPYSMVGGQIRYVASLLEEWGRTDAIQPRRRSPGPKRKQAS